MSKKKSAAIIVATATQPPPKPKEIVQALIARERERLEAIVKAVCEEREAAQKQAAGADKAFALSLLDEKIDATLAENFGQRRGAPTLNYEDRYSWRHSRADRKMWDSKHWVQVSYGDNTHDGRRGATITTEGVIPSKEKTAEAIAYVAAQRRLDAAERAWRDCRYESEKGTLDAHERWIRNELTKFRVRAEGSTVTAPRPPDRVAALLANPETVRALDVIRDRINASEKPDMALIGGAA